MAEIRSVVRSTSAAGHMLGRKLDSIPFSPYHMILIAVLSLVGFVDGYDLVMTGSLLVLAKQPLHLTPEQVRFLAIASTMMICRRRLYRLDDLRPLQPQDHHADRCGRDHLLHLADHAWCRPASS